jgi:hypothetical protein
VIPGRTGRSWIHAGGGPVVGDFKQCSSPCGTFSKVGGVSELRSLQAYAGGESLTRNASGRARR